MQATFFKHPFSGEAGACAGLPFSLEARAPVKPALNEVKLIKKNMYDDDTTKSTPLFRGAHAAQLWKYVFWEFFQRNSVILMLFFRNMLDFLTEYAKYLVYNDKDETGLFWEHVKTLDQAWLSCVETHFEISYYVIYVSRILHISEKRRPVFKMQLNWKMYFKIPWNTIY